MRRAYEIPDSYCYMHLLFYIQDFYYITYARHQKPDNQLLAPCLAAAILAWFKAFWLPC
jgi:hypothetical protein